MLGCSSNSYLGEVEHYFIFIPPTILASHDKSYRPLLTALSAKQSECNTEQEDSIVSKIELTMEMGTAIIVYHPAC